MSDSWPQATDVFQFYNDILAGLGQHLTEPLWQSPMAELRGRQGKIVVTDVGTSGVATRRVVHMLACVERLVIYLNATDTAHDDLGFLRANDLMVMLSHGGNSDELTRLLPGSNTRNVPILSVTESVDSATTKASRLVIFIGIQYEADPLNMLATTSILLALAIFDAACVRLMSEGGYSRETLLSMHSSGDAGLTLGRGKQRQTALLLPTYLQV